MSENILQIVQFECNEYIFKFVNAINNETELDKMTELKDRYVLLITRSKEYISRGPYREKGRIYQKYNQTIDQIKTIYAKNAICEC